MFCVPEGWRSSLRLRLGVGLALALTLLTGLTLLLAHHTLRDLAEGWVGTHLQHEQESLLASLVLRPEGPMVPQTSQSAVFHQPFSGHYFRILTANGSLRSRSWWDADVPDALPAGGSGLFQIAGPLNQHLLMLGRDYVVDGQNVRIHTAEDLTPLLLVLDRLQWIAALLAGLGLLGMLLVQSWIVARTLRPLREAGQALERLAHGEQGSLHLQGPSEIRPLLEGIDRLTALLVRRQQRLRHSLGDLAHAFKTPLAVLEQSAHQHHDVEHLRQVVHEQVATLRQRVERELRRARLAGCGLAAWRAPLCPEVDTLIGILERLHADRALQFERQVPADLLYPGDREDVLELLGNLLDNACQWCRQQVRITARQLDGMVELCVEDDGPGCPPDSRARLLERGQRLDESRPGSGLGLAIVRDLVEEYGGRIALDTSALGGLAVTVHLPTDP